METHQSPQNLSTVSTFGDLATVYRSAILSTHDIRDCQNGTGHQHHIEINLGSILCCLHRIFHLNYGIKLKNVFFGLHIQVHSNINSVRYPYNIFKLSEESRRELNQPFYQASRERAANTFPAL